MTYKVQEATNYQKTLEHIELNQTEVVQLHIFK